MQRAFRSPQSALGKHVGERSGGFITAKVDKAPKNSGTFSESLFTDD